MNTSYDPLYLFIGGEWISAEGRATAAVVNPATAREIGRVPLATTDDLNHALEVARLAQVVHEKQDPHSRFAMVTK